MIRLIAILLFVSSISAAMDCTKATSATEKLVCGEKDLRDLDANITKPFGQLRLALPPEAKKLLGDAQKKWLHYRDECVDKPTKNNQVAISCLKIRYSQRVKLLEKLAKEYTEGSLLPKAKVISFMKIEMDYDRSDSKPAYEDSLTFDYLSDNIFCESKNTEIFNCSMSYGFTYTCDQGRGRSSYSVDVNLGKKSFSVNLKDVSGCTDGSDQ